MPSYNIFNFVWNRKEKRRKRGIAKGREGSRQTVNVIAFAVCCLLPAACLGKFCVLLVFSLKVGYTAI